MDTQLFRVLNLRLDGIVAEIGAHADHLAAQFVGDVLRVFHKRGGRRIVFRTDGDDAHLVRREPEREVAGVMLDQEADEAFVRAERRAMDAERRLVRVVLVTIDEAELGGHGEVHLVGRQREFAADDTPDLHVNLRPVERRFVRHLHVVDLRINQHLPDHVLGLLPERGFVDVFLAQAFRRRRAEAHDVFLDAEKLEILEVHFVHGVEFLGELIGRAIDVRVVHVHGTDAHEAEQLAALLIAITCAVFGQAQREVAITARLGRKNAVVMRAVHGFEETNSSLAGNSLPLTP